MSEQQKKTEKTARQEDSTLWVGRTLIGFVLIVAAALISVYGQFFPHINAWLHSTLNFREAAAWGQLGDFMGGILNPFISACTLAVAVMVWNLQKTELKDTQNTVKKQAKTAEQQRREQRFFDLLNLYQETLKTILVGNMTGKAALVSWPKLSSSALDCSIYLSFGTEEFPSHYGQEIKSTEQLAFHAQTAHKKSLSLQHVESCWGEFSPIFDHYFRTIFAILGELEPLLGDDHWRYGKLFRAQLSRDELTLLAFNLLFDTEGKKMRPLIKKYGILKHLNNNKLREYAIAELDANSFGRKWVKAQLIQKMDKPRA